VRRKLLAVSIAAAIGVIGAVIQSESIQQQPQPLEVQKVKDDLYVIMGSGGNVTARVTPEGVVLIDDKFERNYAEIVEKVKSFTPQPVKYVINTHQHGDHTGGNAQFLKIAEIISHKNARDNMAKSSMPGLARIVFTDQTAVYLGGAEVQAHYMGRGHTNGDAVIYYPDLRVVHAGDLVNEAGPYADYSAGASAVDWPRTFDNIMKLDFDTLIPGHGKVMTRADFQLYKQRMETLMNRLSQLVRQGTSRADLASKLKVDDLTPWNLGTKSNFIAKSLDGVYEELSKMKSR